jgi:hypothetical protein
MGTILSTTTVRTMRAIPSQVLGLTDTLILAIRLCTMLLYLGDLPLKFDALRANIVRGMGNIVSTS